MTSLPFSQTFGSFIQNEALPRRPALLDAEDWRVVRATLTVTIVLVLGGMAGLDLFLGAMLAVDPTTAAAVAAYGLAVDLLPWLLVLTVLSCLVSAICLRAATTLAAHGDHDRPHVRADRDGGGWRYRG